MLRFGYQFYFNMASIETYSQIFPKCSRIPESADPSGFLRRVRASSVSPHPTLPPERFSVLLGGKPDQLGGKPGAPGKKTRWFPAPGRKTWCTWAENPAIPFSWAENPMVSLSSGGKPGDSWP